LKIETKKLNQKKSNYEYNENIRCDLDVRRSGSYNKRIYQSSTELTTPATVPYIASSPDTFSGIDAYVAASANGNSIFLGTASSGTGLYKNAANTPVATELSHFPTTGTRPTVNSRNTAAFYGVYDGTQPGVFLQLDRESFPRNAGNFASSAIAALTNSGVSPASYLSASRIALNEYNQVSYIGTDRLGSQVLYTTTLGPTRSLIAAEDILEFNGSSHTISSLAVFDAVGTNGQTVFFAGTTDGEQLIVRANRHFTQTKLLDSPILPSYKTTGYLLRSVPESGFAFKPISAFGCNLVSTVNLLTFFGVKTSPAEFQNWFLNQYANAPPSRKGDYLLVQGTSSVDFQEGAIAEYSRSLLLSGKSSKTVSYDKTHSTVNGSNLSKLVSELRAGRAVKVHVPNGTDAASFKRYGHYVLAYGLADPSKPDDQMTKADILIADPGHGYIYTLADYGAFTKGHVSGFAYDAYSPNWLEDNYRLTLYRVKDTLQSIMEVAVLSPVEIVVTVPAGRKIGLDPAPESCKV
jgi:hypothetical protein